MKKVDRLGWAAGMCFVAYGRRIGIRANDPEVLERLSHRLPCGWRPAASPIVDHLYSIVAGGNGAQAHTRRFTLVYAGAMQLARTLDLDEALDLLESDLHLYVAARARGKLFVHAGVVGWRGRAIVIPGRTLAGKTTLVAALVRAGATYYSDEYAVLDASGRVHPYTKPLSIRREGSHRPQRLPVESMGAVAGAKPLPIGLILLSRYRAGARWRPRRLSPGQAALALLAETVPARRRPAAAIARLGQIATQAPAFSGVRGEADKLAHALLARGGA
jgi:hypothetical protein